MYTILPLGDNIPLKTVEQRRKMVNDFLDNGGTVTLNGEPAQVAGFKRQFGYVWSSKESYQWSWDAIRRILNKGGAFQTD